jgi:hypothetical protein
MQCSPMKRERTSAQYYQAGKDQYDMIRRCHELTLCPAVLVCSFGHLQEVSFCLMPSIVVVVCWLVGWL